MAIKRGYRGLQGKVVKELKALFRRERYIIPHFKPECELENKIVLGCELLHSYQRQMGKRTQDGPMYDYPDYTICGLFEKRNQLLYDDFSDASVAFANRYVFLGEFQFRLNSEEIRVDSQRWEAMQCYDRIDAFLTEPIKDAICEDCLGEIFRFLVTD